MKSRYATYENEVTNEDVDNSELYTSSRYTRQHARRIMLDHKTFLGYYDEESKEWLPVPEVTIVRDKP